MYLINTPIYAGFSIEHLGFGICVNQLRLFNPQYVPIWDKYCLVSVVYRLVLLILSRQLPNFTCINADNITE